MKAASRWIVAGAALSAALMAGLPAFALGSGPTPGARGHGRANGTGDASAGTGGFPSTTGTGLAPGAGNAVESARLAALKSTAALAIAKREGALTAAEAVIRSTPYLGADQQIVLNQLQSAASGLTSLGATIQADTTTAGAVADAAHVFNEYRVFALVIPVAHLVRAGDAALNVVVPDLGKVAALAQGQISPADGPLLSDLNAQVAKASTDLTGLAAGLEAYTPAEWNANHQLLAADRAALRSARQALGQARADAHRIVADLQIAAPAAPAGSAPSTSPPNSVAATSAPTPSTPTGPPTTAASATTADSTVAR